LLNNFFIISKTIFFLQISDHEILSCELSIKTPTKKSKTCIKMVAKNLFRQFNADRKKGTKTPQKLRNISIDLSTPRRAKKHYLKAANKISQQRKKIRALCQKNRRLNKKLKSLEELLHHLKRKNFISEGASNFISVSKLFNILC